MCRFSVGRSQHGEDGSPGSVRYACPAIPVGWLPPKPPRNGPGDPFSVGSFRVAFYVLIWVLISALPGHADDVEIEVEPGEIISQALYRESINACAPSAMINSLKFGNEGMRSAFGSLLGGNDSTRLVYLVDRYFRNRPSTVVRGEKRWRFHGVYVADLVQSFREILEEQELSPCSAEYLDRIEGETDPQQLNRVHGWMADSLEKGFPPVLSLRSFMVKTRPEHGDEPRWEPGFHHFVVVQSIPRDVLPGAAGMEIRVIDPHTGSISGIHIHPEPAEQPFMALKGNVEKGEWIGGRPFLLVTAPAIRSLRPAGLKWSDRYLVVANYLIGDF